MVPISFSQRSEIAVKRSWSHSMPLSLHSEQRDFAERRYTLKQLS